MNITSSIYHLLTTIDPNQPLETRQKAAQIKQQLLNAQTQLQDLDSCSKDELELKNLQAMLLQKQQQLKKLESLLHDAITQ
jgi:hypothetical protein